MTYLAVAISTVDTGDALAALHRVTGRADLAELRLDLMQSFDLPRLLAERPLPVIVTCRPTREGGRWRGTEVERLAVLRQAAALGAEYVDLEWDVATEIATLDRSRTRIILSRHNFAGMPADLPAQAEWLWAAGADVVTIDAANAKIKGASGIVASNNGADTSDVILLTLTGATVESTAGDAIKVTTNAGDFSIIPGTHDGPRGSMRPEEVEPGMEVDAIGPAGSAYVFHARSIHAGKLKLGSRQRRPARNSRGRRPRPAMHRAVRRRPDHPG